DLDTGIGAGDVIEPRTIQATNLHVLDRLGLFGKIGSLRPSHRNETRCGAQEKAFHHLHLEPPNIVSLERDPYPPSAIGTDGTSPCSPLSGKTFHTVSLMTVKRDLGMPPSVALRTLSDET